jgi:hypothetical protein
MRVSQMDPKGHLLRHDPPMHPDAGVEDPSCRGRLGALTFGVRQCRPVVLECVANAVFPCGIYQPTDRHHQQPRHDPRGLFERPRGGQTRWVFEKSTSVFGLPVTFRAVASLPSRPLVVVEGVGGEDDTTVRVDEGLMGRKPRGQGPLHRGHDGIRPSALAWSPPFPSMCCGADGTLLQTRRLPTLRNGRQGWRRLSFTGTGRVAPWLAGFACLVTGLQPLCVPRARRLRRAGLDVDEDPAWLHVTGGRAPRVRAIAGHQRRHGLGIGMGACLLGVRTGGRDTRHPRQPSRGERLEGGCAREGTIGA